MPNYEYRCTSCENQFEIWQEVGAAPPPCPECNSEVRKVFHPVRTIFKGSGFYVTDLRAEKEKSSSPAKTASPSDESQSGESNTETKSETPAQPTAPAKIDSSTPGSTPAPAATPAKTD